MVFSDFQEELQNFFSGLAQKQQLHRNPREAEIFAVMLSWSLYGAAIGCTIQRRNRKTTSSKSWNLWNWR